MLEIPIPNAIFDPRMQGNPGAAIASHAIFEHIYTRELFTAENRYRREHGTQPIPGTEDGLYIKEPILPYVALASLSEFSLKSIKTIYLNIKTEGIGAGRNWDALLLKSIEEGHKGVVRMMPEILVEPIATYCIKQTVIGIRGLLGKKKASGVETSHR
ncbi:hypothetical protein GMRT_12581 [Giardia muris]|uniref:Uncharacterized protein n=1 Tax=Giardia muris TaxID=5742 RepID=A0A4Z1T7B1_GIAMU|nr:hypothetical protein GMRT_12581 [Giardia muris]|eukprot:TNJ28449.1 hypothetical protein GMRT_12581 [Giardia muris]